MTFKTPPDDNKLKRMPRVIREAAGKAGTPAPGARVPIGHGAKFERMKEEVITVLAGHPNVEEAARLLKISTATLYRWKKIPEIAAGVDEARQIQYEQALGRVQRGAGTAVTILLKLMHDSELPAGVRLQAADCLARHRKATGRLARLEQRLQAVQRFREDSLAEQAGPSKSAPRHYSPPRTPLAAARDCLYPIYRFVIVSSSVAMPSRSGQTSTQLLFDP